MEEEIKFNHAMPAQIRFSDVDQFGHVNNSVYFSLYDLAKTTYFRDVLGLSEWGDVAVVVANINANFLMPVFFSDNIKIETATVQLGNKSFTLLQRAVVKGTGEVKCECHTTMVMYDLLTKEPTSIPQHYKNAICRFEGKTLDELAKK
ncbi:MAG: acyl-CoA thioesterase [Bacteroidaceae bacterium]|nr:acyl-CoA thioesterase [Bacteroidaceae bacterium]